MWRDILSSFLCVVVDCFGVNACIHFVCILQYFCTSLSFMLVCRKINLL